jgi:hypothetical protein
MSEHNSEIWAELERLSRRMARIEVVLTDRILDLQAQIKALKKATAPICNDWPAEDPGEPVEVDTDWFRENIGNEVVREIMRQDPGGR